MLMRHRKKGDEMLVAAVRWKMEGGRGDSWCFCSRGMELDGMLVAAMRWKTEGGRGDSWRLCPRERMEMKCLLLLCAGRWREEKGIPGVVMR